MNTVIFKWNPSFSSYTMRGFLTDMPHIDDDCPDFDWSVWQHDQIHSGDEFFWLKVGFGQTGIVGHGIITSEPYEGEDWSGKGRQTYYVTFSPDIMICPDAFRLLDSDTLEEAIPDFDWRAGHSGMVLNETMATALHKLWEAYLEANKEAFDRAKAENLAVRRRIEEIIYDNGDINVKVIITEEETSITVNDGAHETQVYTWDTDEALQGYGCANNRQLYDELRRRYAHPHAARSFSQDLLSLQVAFSTSFHEAVQDK